MTHKCRYCASERVVPVLYARMTEPWVEGNKYRLRCRECQRWLPCCSATAWKTHADPHVLPADVDPDDPELVPVEQTDFADRIDSNYFDCPRSGCEASHTGYPDECGACGVSYNW